MLHSHSIIVHEHGCSQNAQGRPMRRDTWKLPAFVANQFRRAIYFEPAGIIADVMRDCKIGMIRFKPTGPTPYKPKENGEEDFEIEFIDGDVNEAARRLLDHFTVVARLES